jgi:lipopolysaccharide exporter
MVQHNAATLASQQAIEQKVSRSLAALVVRQVLAYGAIFLGNVFLSRWLSQEVYGIFAAAFAFQAALVLLSDVGLGPALIQRAERPTGEELASLFTVQLVLFGVVAAGAWLFAPTIAEMADLGRETAFLVRALALVFLVTALRSIPAMLLERDLRFDVIALTETVSTVIYQGVLVALVYAGWGLNSIVWALAARYLSDLLIVFRFYPWRPRFSSRLRLIWPYLRFGLGMQGVRLLAYVKDQLPLLVLVPLLGAASAGQWGWAIAYVAIPIYFNRLIDRIMFPAYARVQHDRAAIGAMAGTALWLNFAVGLPLIVVLVAFAGTIIPLIYSSSWLVALPVVVLLAPNMVGGFITGSLFPIFYATGQSRKAVKLFGVWVALNTVLAGLGLWLAGLRGLAVGFSVTTLIMAVVLLREVRPVAEVRLREAVSTPALATVGATLAALLALAVRLPWFVALMAGGCVYAVCIYVLASARIHALLGLGLTKA